MPFCCGLKNFKQEYTYLFDRYTECTVCQYNLHVCLLIVSCLFQPNSAQSIFGWRGFQIDETKGIILFWMIFLHLFNQKIFLWILLWGKIIHILIKLGCNIHNCILTKYLWREVIIHGIIYIDKTCVWQSFQMFKAG